VKKFKYFFILEINRQLNPIVLVLALLFFAISMYFVQQGVNRYRDISNNKGDFQEIEQAKVKNQINYSNYCAHGFRIIVLIPSMSIFFSNSGAFSELSAALDVGYRLEMNGTYKGNHMFRELKVMYSDFSGLYVLFGTFIVLLYGYFSLRNREYIKQLGSIGGTRRVYRSILRARYLVLVLYFTLITALGTVLALVNGVHFTGKEALYITGFQVVWLLAALVLFKAGNLIGGIRSNKFGAAVLAVTCAFLVYLAPLLVKQLVDMAAANLKSVYRLENEEWAALMKFEKRAIEVLGAFDPKKANSPEERAAVESFLQGEYRTMRELEKKMENEMRAMVKIYQWLSLITTTTFLSSMICELSGNGYEEMLDFYRYSGELKDRFCQFYKEKKFYTENTGKGVESFIKGEENVYYGRGRLPANFIWGIFMLVVWVLVLDRAAYSRHKKALSEVKGTGPAGWDPGSLAVAGGSFGVYQVEEAGYYQVMYNYLAKKFKKFLYLCHPGEIPADIRAGDLIGLTAGLLGIARPVIEPAWKKTFAMMDNLEKFKVSMVLTELSQRAGVVYYLFYNIARDMPIDAPVLLKKRMEELSGEGAAVIFFTREQLVAIERKGKRYGVREAAAWSEQVERLERILKEE